MRVTTIESQRFASLNPDVELQDWPINLNRYDHFTLPSRNYYISRQFNTTQLCFTSIELKHIRCKIPRVSAGCFAQNTGCFSA